MRALQSIDINSNQQLNNSNRPYKIQTDGSQMLKEINSLIIS